ncbi:hypothetical protein Tco_0341516 [Tanacetum coccineum]
MDECHKLLTNKVDMSNPEGHQILRNIYEPLPLGGPPGQVTIQPHFFFNKDLDYLLTGDKEQKIALSISKLKSCSLPNLALEEISSIFVVDSERNMTSVRLLHHSTGGFRRKEFYINQTHEPSARESVRSQMCEFHVISVQGIRVGDCHLGIESYQTKINLERPNWDAADYYFKEDYTIVPKPRAVVYRDRNNQRKLMRLNELHKFSDGTLTRVMEKLDQMVKDFHLFEYNKGMETRKWSEDDKRRSKDFITAIEKRLQIRRIYRSLESFVAVCSSLRLLKPKRTIESRAKRSSINLDRTQHPSETIVFHNEDGNPVEANIKQALELGIFLNDGDGRMEIPSVKASANSDVMYPITSAQDGDSLQDDVRLCLGNDLKKAQDHSQRQAEHEVLAPVNIFLRPKSGVHPWISLVDPKFLNAIVQRFTICCQSAITELVIS